jgi:hypothetical protein
MLIDCPVWSRMFDKIKSANALRLINNYSRDGLCSSLYNSFNILRLNLDITLPLLLSILEDDMVAI